MIQAVTSFKATPLRKHSANFGNNTPSQQMPSMAGSGVEKQAKNSKGKALAQYLGTQFIAGFVVSGIFEGIRNAYHVIRKNPQSINPLPVVGANAVMTGLGFAIIGATFAVIDLISSRKKQ